MKMLTKIHTIGMKSNIIALITLLFLPFISFSQFYISPNASVSITQNAVIQINTNLYLSNNSNLVQNDTGTIFITGDWINNGGTFNPGNGVVIFVGSNNSVIGGTGLTNFNYLRIYKTLDGNDVVEIQGNFNVNRDLWVLDGILRFGNNSYFVVQVDRDVIVSSGASFDVTSSLPNALDTLKIVRNLFADGSVNFNNGNGKVYLFFVGSGSSNFFGSGNISLSELIVKKSNANDTVFLSRTINAPDGFLTLDTGIFRVNGTFNFSNTFFKPQTGTGNYVIPYTATFWLDNPNVVVSPQASAGNLYLRGTLRVSQGSYNVGSTGESSIVYDNPTPSSSKLIVDGGDLNIRTGLFPQTYSTNLIEFNFSSGNIYVGSGSSSTVSSVGMFDISASGSTFDWTGGTIELRRTASNTVADYVVLANNGTVSGGTLKINAQASSQQFDINSTKPVNQFEMTGTNNPTVRLVSNNFTVLNNIILAGSGSNLFNTNNLNVTLGGNWINNFASADGFNPTNSYVIFNGSSTQSIGGSQNTRFYNLTINKSGGNVELDIPCQVDSALRLVSNTIFDLNSNDLTLGVNGKIFSNAGTQDNVQTFSANKYILNSGSGSNPLSGGRLIKRISPSATLPLDLNFPVGTPNSYTPAIITFNIGGATFGSNAFVSIKPVPLEHPEIEASNKSLAKYWVVDNGDINISSQGATVSFYYSPSEVNGNEGAYVVLYYSPSYNNPNGYWRINPGTNNYVDYNNRFFYSQLLDSIRGDWTAGESDAAFAVFYARADGDFNTPSTWSNINFNGTASTKYPSKLHHRVRIQDHEITINANIPSLNLISVENGTEGRTPGILRFTGSNYVQGDTFRIEQNAKLIITHPDGVSPSPSMTGAIRTTVRDLSNLAIYEFAGTGAQVTGTGLPNSVRGFIVNKPSGQTLLLQKSIQIADSLVINDGIFDLSSHSINGQSSGRSLIMRGGELVIRQSFPNNYTPPTFTAGRITFDGTGNVTIPSSGSNPAVNQYYDLKISGNLRAGNVTFSSSGEIRIKNVLDISGLNFANNTYRFFTNGSTVRFNKNGGTQQIPFVPASPSDSVVFLEYYNLILDSVGTKIITGTGTPTFKVLGNLTLTNGSTFSSNNFNIELQGNWVNENGSVFQPGNSWVIFRNSNSLTTNTITSRDTSDNPFNNILIAGTGTIKALDALKILGNITISSNSIFEMTNNFLSLYGNWTNLGGTFNYGTSTVAFNNNSVQYINKTSGSENFYNLTVNNSSDINILGVGTSTNDGVIVNNNLVLTNGSIRGKSGTNFRYVRVLGSISRPGGGFVDAELQKIVGTGNQSVTFEVGHQTNYTPVQLDFVGSDGNSGLLGVLSDTITTSSSPISWSDPTPNSILPAGSGMSPQKHVARQYTVRIPTGSSFQLGTARKYNATLTFIGNPAPNGDLRNGANTNLFEVRLLSGSNWINPYYYGTTPIIGTRTTNSTRYDSLMNFGTFIVGEPGILTFFTRASGNWNVSTNWSTQGYGGSPATEYPGQTTNLFRAYIGNGNEITLVSNVTVNTVANDTGWVQVDSSGVLNFTTYYIGGTGQFRLAKDGILKTSNVDGFRQTGNNGSVQTTVRNFNFGNHNRGHFVYTGSSTQTQQNEALPTTIATLTIDKTGGTLTFNRALAISDSLFIKSGSLSLGADLTINGNIRRNSGTSFNPTTRTITISGINPDTITNLHSSPLQFYNLTLAKPANSGNVVLAQNTVISVSNNLTFSTSGTNKSLIDARTYSGAYVQIESGGTISNASQARGWIDGELRMYIPSGDAPAITFAIGDSVTYSPFMIDFASGTGSQAGFLAATVFPGVHPYMDNSYNPPVAPSRLIGPKWWRLTKPQGSTFQRGTRNFSPRAYFKVPGDDAYVDYWGCVDLTYCRKWTGGVQWQPLYPNSTLSNDGTVGCSDTRGTGLTPSFTYSGALSGGLAYVNVANVNTSFGSTEVIGNDTLLGDFVSGNQNTIARFYTFYSVNDGDWTDPATWSTVSLNDTINPTNAAASDTTGGRNRIIYGFPRRQYDNVVIGNGKTVRLNTNIGTNTLSTVYEVNALAGPSVTVLNSGTLDLNYHVLRGMSFKVYPEGKILVGSTSGITNGNSGNVNLYPGTLPTYSDSIDIVYTAQGLTSDVIRYTLPNRNGSTHYLERVLVRNSSGDTLLINITLDTLTRSTYCINHYLHKKATLIAGSTYYLQIDPAGTGNRRYKVWIDYNRNGSYTDAGEEVINTNSNSTNLFSTPTFTVPSNANPGSTQMRVGMRNNNNDFGPNDGGTGEFEEYTIDIVNPNVNITQQTGAGLPNLVRSFQVHSPRSGSTVQLGKSITVLDSVRVRSGILNAQSNTITLYGDFVVDTVNGFNPSTSTINFVGSSTSSIRGSGGNISFNIVNLRKNDGDTVNVSTNVIIQNSMTFDSTNFVNLFDDDTITFQTNGALNYTGSAFSKNKMILLTGNTNCGTVRKIFPSGTGVTRTFLFPVGIDTIFNQANLSITGNFSTGSEIQLRMRNQQHPNRLNDSILTKFWRIEASGISNITASSYQFDFHIQDVVGDLTRYIPSRYKTTTGWEINLGNNPNISATTYGYRINITNDTSYDGSKLLGHWTAGIPTTFFNGRIFYSRNTGKWNLPSNWSNVSHTGPPAAYYPGSIYVSDTVNIDGHTIYFNVSYAQIDSLRIGGTNSTPPGGQLRFDSTGNNKILKTRQLLVDNEPATLISTSGYTATTARKKIDTLIVTQNIINNCPGPWGIYLFPNPNPNDSDYVVLKLAGSGNSIIQGGGYWTKPRSIVIDKQNGLTDTVFVQSNGLCYGTNNSYTHFFLLKNGILAQSTPSATLYLSGMDIFPIYMEDSSGISVLSGQVISRSSIYTDANTIIHLKKGNLYVGYPYQYSTIFGSLYYSTGTKVVIDTGLFDIAHSFARRFSGSTVDFTIGPLGVVKVNTVTMGTYPANEIAFDISNAGSTFNMTGGRIIIANAKGATPSTFDFRVNAQNGLGMTGGTIQSGDTTLTPNGAIIKIGGTIPIHNLHFANNPSRSVTTQINEQTFTIAGDWSIDVNHTFNLAGNTVRLGGNLYNWGNFYGAPTSPSSDPWLLEINGTNNQILANYNSSLPLEIYNFRLNKSSGNLSLSPTGYSRLIIRNSLEFSTSNQAYLHAPTQPSGQYVALIPLTGATATIIRNGFGHIYGWLYRYIGTGTETVFYPVGYQSNYRPVNITTYGTNNTPGLLGVLSFNYMHPWLVNANVDTNKCLTTYWKIDPLSSNPFGLGASGYFNLSLQFLNPNDVKSGSNINEFEVYNHYPACPDYPNTCTNPGTWTRLTTTNKTDTTLFAINISQFGDFTAGTPLGIVFWSRNNGLWNDPTTWSWKSYYEDSIPSRIPNQAYDIVRIGNGKTVTIPSGFVPNVMNVIVEKDSLNNQPGTLLINGTLGYLAGNSFILEDSCTLGIQNQYGITLSGNVGAVQTSIRNFGVSRYFYSNTSSAINTGLGLPDSVLTIIVNNTFASNPSVFLSNYSGAPAIKIKDTLLIQQGTFNAGNRNLALYGVMILDSATLDGKFEPTSSQVFFSGSNDKYIILRNNSGVRFYDVVVNGGDVKVQRPVVNNPNRQHVTISNTLNFNNPNTFISLNDYVNLRIANSSANAILNFGSNRYVKTSLGSGLLIRSISPNNTYTFPIGSDNVYAPSIFEAENTGSAGVVGVKTSRGQSSYQTDGHIGLSSSTSAVYLKRYWTIDSVSAQTNGRWTFYYEESEVVGNESDLSKIGRWRPAWENPSGSWAFPFTSSNINTTNNTFQTDANFAYSGFYGDWTIGNENAFRRIFYSRQSGLWSDFQSWTYSPTHSGPVAGVGLFPNAPGDSVVVGGGSNGVNNHVITLDINNPFGTGENAGVSVGTGQNNTGTLDLQNNVLNGYYFTLSDYSTIKIGSPFGINAIGTNSGNIQTSVTRNFSTNGIYVYSGNTSQVIGNGLPSSVYSFIVQNTGTYPNNQVTIDKDITVGKDLLILSGTLNLQTYSMNSVLFGSGTFQMDANTMLKVGGTNNLAGVINNYQNYSIASTSVIEFNGTNQTISNLPVNLTQDFINNTGGLGTVWLSNSGTKIVSQPLLIRGNLLTFDAITLLNSTGVDALSVRGSIINNASIFNEGVIEIGNCP